MIHFKRYSKIYPIIGGYITLIALFTPTSFSSSEIAIYFVWIIQIYFMVYPQIEFSLGRDNIILLLFSTILTVIIFFCAIIIIKSSQNYRKSFQDFQRFKKKGLLLSMLIIISTLAWIIMIEVFYIIYGANHWIGFGGHYLPHFGVIGPFLGSAFILIGIFIEKDAKIEKE